LSQLDDEERALLQFVLDTTIEQWKQELPISLTSIEQDPSVTSWEDLLELTGGQSEMIAMLSNIRTKILEESRG
jgi:hypothetical protein